MQLTRFLSIILFGAFISPMVLAQTSTSISLKIPGNDAVNYPLQGKTRSGKTVFQFADGVDAPANISQTKTENEGGYRLVTTIEANEDIYFNFAQKLNTGFRHEDCQFYLPGFWYRQNLRSPKEAPSFHTSDTWIFREDRLSAPQTSIYDESTGEYITVSRIDNFASDALSTHTAGEVILSGKTSVGYTGFENEKGIANVSFGFPFHEAPRTYIRKLTLAPEVIAYQKLGKGESISLTWDVRMDKATDFSDFIAQSWMYAYDLYNPQTVQTPYTPEVMKDVMTNYFTESFVGDHPIKYTSGVHQVIDRCTNTGIAEVGFVGRVLLNAFNALEYGEQNNRQDLIGYSNQIFASYLDHGFTPNGFFREMVDFSNNNEETNLSIRRQSEGLYAMIYFLQYEKKQGRNHPQWEFRVKNMLEGILQLQKEDGSFPRKFKDNLEIVDATGGSTPSATPMLVLASSYFKQKKYLDAAKKTALYLDKEIISKADYFSSTLDANCEDKEASFYATTALYHLSLFTKGKESRHYRELARKSAYFCLSWYYLWDVPFAPGQMLGDIGLKTRGWGNVSVENNHIDVYIFDFATILNWLSQEYDDARLSEFSRVIQTSMCQLLPEDGHRCGIAKNGFYPEVVQHTNWDYGRNGKGFYNDLFAPGWTIASLWEMLTPERIRLFVK